MIPRAGRGNDQFEHHVCPGKGLQGLTTPHNTLTTNTGMKPT